jgi:hypothetical protein
LAWMACIPDGPNLSWGNPTQWRGGLSGGRAIMMIMHVRVVELLCQAAMGRALVLKYLVLGARGCL